MNADRRRKGSAALRRGIVATLCLAATASGLAIAAKPGGGGSTTWTVRLQGIGDSIMEGYNATCQGNVSLVDLFCYSGGDQPENSFFDGTSSAVVSLADRFIAAGASTTYSKAAAQSGSEMVGGSNNFATQAAAVVAASRKPVQVKVELGGNDICNRPSTGQMYSDDTWRAAVRAGLDTLTNRLPDGSTVLLVGVPRVQDLYAAGVAKSAGSTRVNCESFWRTYDVCQLATRNAVYGGEDLATRLPKVAARQLRYNEILREEALGYNARAAQTRVEVVAETDGVFGSTTPEVGNYSFSKDEINGGDCFHPSILGQNTVSAVVWGNDPNRVRR
jgi:lysophospholipase L1-like esterase